MNEEKETNEEDKNRNRNSLFREQENQMQLEQCLGRFARSLVLSRESKNYIELKKALAGKEK